MFRVHYNLKIIEPVINYSWPKSLNDFTAGLSCLNNLSTE